LVDQNRGTVAKPKPKPKPKHQQEAVLSAPALAPACAVVDEASERGRKG
jgi:hypothetical protein